MPSFTDHQWQATEPLYRAILDLPFNRELAAGTLSQERFVHYMVQDAHYLLAFSRALAVAAAKAPDAAAQAKLAQSAHDAILVERSLHEEFFQAFGLSAAAFARTRPSPTCAGYGDFLLATAYVRPFPVAVAALVPCFQIYYEVGKHLYGIAVAANPYQKWIDTYRDEAFGTSVREILALTDAAHDVAGGADRDAMAEAHLQATRYEWMFWDAAWRLEAWPV